MLTNLNLKLKQSTPPPPPRENYLNKNKINKKSISPIIATLLIITVSVVLGVSMYDWYSEYTKTISSDIGDKGFSKEIRIDYINQNTIYAFNEYTKAQIKSISVDGNECDLIDSNNNFSKGTIQISFDESCTQNLNSNINEVVVVSDKGTYSTLLSISNSNYVFSNDDDSKDSNGGSEAIINYCLSGSFTYENVLFDYLDIEDGLTKNIVEVDSISGGSKTSYINITCNYPSIDYDSDSFRSSVVCDTGYLLNSLEDSCELIINYCSSGSFVYNGELFPYPDLENSSEYSSSKTEVILKSNLIKTKTLNLSCQNTIVSNTSYEEVPSCLDNYELNKVKNYLESKKITASDGTTEDIFGRVVSIYEDTIVVGAYGDDDKGSNSGSAYIFEKNSNGEFEQIQKIKASDGASNDYFGYSVSIYENTIVVGAYGDDDRRGSAYIFEKNSNGEWNQIQKITASYGRADDMFGYSVSIYEDTLVVGVNIEDNEKIYVFEKNEDKNWYENQKLTIRNFIYDISIYENIIVVGSREYFSSSGTSFIFERNEDGNWHQKMRFGGSKSDYVGNSVSIYEDIIVAGLTGDDDKGSDSGSVYIFERNQNEVWDKIQKTAKDGEKNHKFGSSVSIYEDMIVVGARYDDDKDFNSGSVYIFERNQNEGYKQIKKITASDGASSDWFGTSVSIYEDTIVVGATGDDDKGTNSGSIYIFEAGEKENYCVQN